MHLNCNAHRFALLLLMFARALSRPLLRRPPERGLAQMRMCAASGSTRPASNDKSLDVSLIASEPELVMQHLRARRASESVVGDLLAIGDLRARRNSLIFESDKAKSQRKTLSAQIGQMMKEKKDQEVAALKLEVESVSAIAAKADEELKDIDAEMSKLVSYIPNLLDDRVPEGDSDADNREVFSWGAERRKMGEGFLWHDEIATGLGGLDADAAVRVSGARFSVLKGSVARLERAITQYFLDFHVGRGYEEVSVPYIVSRSTLEGTGQLPKFEEDLFKVSHSVGGEDAFLIPTAEVPVTNLYRDLLLDAAELPISHVCLSPCFRAEAGSYGRDTRGLLRQHQFHKVELVKIVSPETSSAEHEKMTGDAEALLQSLELPYRKVLLCSGDVGFSARICYDLEVWLPGQQAYREISSCSNCYDFQARRMSLRYRVGAPGGKKDAKSKTTAHPHTLNGSGVAVGRALVAILENYQEADGSVVVPEKLRAYMGGLGKIAVRGKG